MALPSPQCCTITKEQGREEKAWVLSKQPLTLGRGLLPTASFILGFKQRRKGFHWRPSKPTGLEKQSPAILTCAHSTCLAALRPSLAEYLWEAFYSLCPFHCQELHNRVSWPCQWSKNTLLEFLSSDDLHTSLLRPQGFNLVPGCLIGGYSIKCRGPFIPHRGFSGMVDRLDLRAKPPGFKSQLYHLLVMELYTNHYIEPQFPCL